jgi:hypothetical protein
VCRVRERRHRHQLAVGYHPRPVQRSVSSSGLPGTWPRGAGGEPTVVYQLPGPNDGGCSRPGRVPNGIAPVRRWKVPVRVSASPSNRTYFCHRHQAGNRGGVPPLPTGARLPVAICPYSRLPGKFGAMV